MRSNSTETLGGGKDEMWQPYPPTYLDKHCAIYSAPSVKKFLSTGLSKTQRERVSVRLHGFCRCDTVGLRVIPSGKIILLLDAGHYSTQSVL